MNVASQTCTQRWIFIKILRNYTDGVLKNLVIFELEIRLLICVKYIISMVLMDTNQWKNQNDILINLKLLSDWYMMPNWENTDFY